MNRLARETSAYLQHAALQKIDWYPWSDEPFERALKEDKAVFLSSGAIWCHWCHVMAKESFHDDEVAQLLNEHFIAVKLDRDERPDIDKRYQRAVAAMGLGGGWPLSVFLTPDRRPFYGGTYFPPSEQHGRPGFKSILLTIANMYREKREEIYDHSSKIVSFLNQFTRTPGDIGEDLVEEGVREILAELDTRNGGFGEAPKFPMSGAMEFLLNRYFLSNNIKAGEGMKNTLTAMARGGIHDHLRGGFHRYSTDHLWIIPHFEKMCDDNAWLLKNYAEGYAIFGDPLFREVAQGIARFMMEELSGPGGGFYASQDADVTPDDEGGYFTWTHEDFKKVLTDEEYGALSACYLHERGMMRHDNARYVLYAPRSVDEVARDRGVDAHHLHQVMAAGKRKLLAHRETREKPIIDRALYTSLNGMTISAFLTAYRVLGDKSLKEHGLKSLGKILDLNVVNGELYHCAGIKALLDDYIHLSDACLSAYEVTGEKSCLTQGEGLMTRCLERFLDKESGGFFDTEEEILGMRLKGVEDSPHPSSNALAIVLLVRLSNMTGNNTYLHVAETCLRAFSTEARAMGVHAGYYLVALDAWFNQLKLEVQAPPDSELGRAAIGAFHPYTTIVWGEDKGTIIPCARAACYEPLFEAGKLKAFLGGRRSG